MDMDFVSMINDVNKDGFDELSYIYLCPVYKEGLDVLDPSFNAWSKSDVGAKNTCSCRYGRENS